MKTAALPQAAVNTPYMQDNCAYALKDQASNEQSHRSNGELKYLYREKGVSCRETGENLSKVKTTDALDSDDPGSVFLMRIRQCRNLISRRRG